MKEKIDQYNLLRGQLVAKCVTFKQLKYLHIGWLEKAVFIPAQQNFTTGQNSVIVGYEVNNQLKVIFRCDAININNLENNRRKSLEGGYGSITNINIIISQIADLFPVINRGSANNEKEEIINYSLHRMQRLLDVINEKIACLANKVTLFEQMINNSQYSLQIVPVSPMVFLLPMQMTNPSVFGNMGLNDGANNANTSANSVAFQPPAKKSRRR